LAADRHTDAVGLRHWVVAHIATALFRGHRLDLVVDADAGNRWLHRNGDLAAIVAGNKAQGLEVDQQRVGLDQERLVFIPAVVVELRQVGLHEVAAVQHQVTGDGAHAIGAQVTHQQPQLFHVQFGVPATFEVQVTVEHPVAQGAVRIELGFPLKGRAQQLEGGVSGDQFHGRGRVHRNIGIEHGRGSGAVQRQHHQRQRSVLQLVGLECLLHFGRQGGIDGGGVAGQGNWQQQAGEKEGTKRFDHSE